MTKLTFGGGVRSAIWLASALAAVDFDPGAAIDP